MKGQTLEDGVVLIVFAKYSAWIITVGIMEGSYIKAIVDNLKKDQFALKESKFHNRSFDVSLQSTHQKRWQSNSSEISQYGTSTLYLLLTLDLPLATRGVDVAFLPQVQSDIAARIYVYTQYKMFQGSENYGVNLQSTHQKRRRSNSSDVWQHGTSTQYLLLTLDLPLATRGVDVAFLPQVQSDIAALDGI
ncbi:hypothetical protein BD770DRAFT_431018 [Pilaira anomala]|nr:hypothetical protein BD770DRAFT_431018 [Pilaira anomala]